jgi:hypothetical protein
MGCLGNPDKKPGIFFVFWQFPEIQIKIPGNPNKKPKIQTKNN